MSHTVECRYMSTFQGYSSSKIYLPAENISVCIRTFLSFFFRLSTQFGTEKSYLGGGGIAHWNSYLLLKDGGLVVGMLRIRLRNTPLHELSEPGSVNLVEVLLHEAAKSWTVDFVKVLLVEAVEAAAVDFVHVSLLTAEGISAIKTEKQRLEEINVHTTIIQYFIKWKLSFDCRTSYSFHCHKSEITFLVFQERN